MAVQLNSQEPLFWTTFRGKEQRLSAPQGLVRAPVLEALGDTEGHISDRVNGWGHFIPVCILVISPEFPDRVGVAIEHPVTKASTISWLRPSAISVITHLSSPGESAEASTGRIITP